MSTRIWDRARRLRSLAACVAVLAAALVVVVLVGSRVPDAWWPKTGEAFAASPQPRPAPHHAEACDLVVGPAHDYCTHGTVQRAAPTPDFDATDAWMILPPAAGLLILGILRLREARRS